MRRYEGMHEKWEKIVKEVKRFYVFGAGKIGKETAVTLRYLDCFAGFIDNDINKQGNGCEKAISLDEYKIDPNTRIAICVSESYSGEIEEQLRKKGMKSGKDYYTYDYFRTKILPAWAFYVRNKIFVAVTQISLTERCTLRCKKCAHACYAVDQNVSDMDLDEAKRSIDAFFSLVDFVQEFVLIGGEPLLYKNLADVVSYVGTKYTSKVGLLSITTNGTLCPDDELLSMAQKNGVLFHISNYVNSIPALEHSQKRLLDVLDQHQIRYILGSREISWVDYGFEDYIRTEEDLERVFDQCNTLCHEIRGTRFYFCVMARAVSENLKINIGEEDFYNMDDSDYDLYSNRKNFFEYILGYSDKGYLEMCKRCRGAEASNYKIPAAQQKEG